MPVLSEETLHSVLLHGEISLQGQFTLGSNYTFLVDVTYEGQTVPAVYKPSKGEQPLWDFPENSLAWREVAAYLVSEAITWRFVPYTILREEGPYGPGSLQQYIDYNPNYHYFTFKDDDKVRLRPVVLFDLLVNNADRKGSHVIIQKRSRKMFLIDHGLCFHEDDKLRTVIWDFAGEAILPELIVDIVKFRAALSSPGLRADLERYLSLGEIEALDARASALIASAMFPLPPRDRRAFPYPPV